MTTAKQLKKAAHQRAAARGIPYVQAIRELREEAEDRSNVSSAGGVLFGGLQAGGSGKTTSTVNLAEAIAARNVVLLDLDGDSAASPARLPVPPMFLSSSTHLAEGTLGGRTVADVLRAWADRTQKPVILDVGSKATVVRRVADLLVAWVIAAARTEDPHQIAAWCARQGRPLAEAQRNVLAALLAATPHLGDEELRLDADTDYLDNLIAALSDKHLAIVDPAMFDEMIEFLGRPTPPA